MKNAPTLEQRQEMCRRPDDVMVMHQCWERLLFLHWEMEPAILASTLPKGLSLDTHEGKAYIGVVPFFMRGIRPRFCPSVPGISDFLEMNLRTYVHDAQGRPGVWFYSLDANQPLAVMVARALFRLPYQHASMSAQLESGDWVRYRSRRSWTQVETDYLYRGVGEASACTPGTLEYFLAERYLLYSGDDNGLYCGRVYHTPYPLMKAEVERWSDRLLLLSGFDSPGRPPDLRHYSPGVRVEVFPLRAAGG